MLKVLNQDRVFAEMDAWLDAVKRELEDIARGLASQALRRLVFNSPQYSGDFAANWRVSINTPDTRFDVGAIVLTPKKGFKPFIQGDMPAINRAISNADGNLDAFHLGDTIWIANSARHDELYAWKIEDNQISFRPGNYGETLRLTLDDLRITYASITPSLATRLIQARL